MRRQRVFIAAETERITGHDLPRLQDIRGCLLQLLVRLRAPVKNKEIT